MTVTGSNSRTDLLFSGGEMGKLIHSFDWSTTSLGPIESWQQSLRTALSICLSSTFPICVWWGPKLIQFYNDGYIPILGAKHPQSLGQQVYDCFTELRDFIYPLFEGVRTTGQPTFFEDRQLFLERYGYIEETYFTFSVSPIHDETGGIGGLFHPVTETTKRVLSERRLATLRELGANTAEAKTVAAACSAVTQVLAGNRADIPFALLYLLDDDQRVRLMATAGIQPDLPISPIQIELSNSNPEFSQWSLLQMINTLQPELVENLQEKFASAVPNLTLGEHTACPHKALMLPITKPGEKRLAGVLVTGISPFLELDEAYRGFLELVAGGIATAVATARTYEEERRRAEALAELDRAKTVFFSNVSHEFRTPLTLILGPLEDLLASEELLPSEREQLEIVHRNALRLMKLVNTLLDFSRIEAGRIQAIYEPTDLAMLTTDLAAVFRSAIERAGLQLHVDCPPLPEPVYVNRDMWEKIVLNLLSNAFKFTFAGEIAVVLRARDKCIELTVRDTGVGIPAKEIPRLFERFYRVLGARGRTYEGSGIGLSLVQELVKLHGGTIQVESVVYQGTRFIVSIPTGSAHLPNECIGASQTLASTASGTAPYIEEALRWLPQAETKNWEPETREDFSFKPQLNSSSSSPDSARILIADDNADLRDYLKRLLSPIYKVEAVADGAAALAAVREQVPDLVLTDVMMPGVDGFELLRQLRAAQSTREVPIILLTARAGQESRVEALEAGADDYLLKPFSARELLARVQANLEMARVRQESARRVEAERAFLNAVLQQMPVGVIIGEAPNGKLILSNEQVIQVLRHPFLPAAQMAEYEHYQVFHSDGQPYNFNEYPLARALKQGEVVVSEEISYLCGDGTYRTLSANAAPIYDTNGQIIAGVVTFYDITERKLLETKLQQLNTNLERLVAKRTAQLRQALEFEAMLFRITDKVRNSLDESQILQTAVQELAILLDASCCNTTLYDQEQGTSTICYEYARHNPGVQARQIQMAIPELYQQLQQGEYCQFCSLTPNPMRGRVVMLACPIFDDQGALGDLWLINQPQYAFSEVEIQLVQQVAAQCAIAIRQARLYTAATAQVAELEKLNRLKDDFLDTVSHELRTPMTSIKMAISMLEVILLKPGFLSTETNRAAQYLQILRNSCQREISLIDDLLDMSRLDNANEPLSLTKLDLKDWFSRIAESFAERVRIQQQNLEINIPTDLPALTTDEAKLERIFTELLHNACKYTPASEQILITATTQSDTVRLQLSNSGVEIPEGELCRIFDKFYRIPNNDPWKHGGTGLGLALVKKLVEHLGGSISATASGGCTTFTVDLPISPAQ